MEFSQKEIDKRVAVLCKDNGSFKDGKDPGDGGPIFRPFPRGSVLKGELDLCLPANADYENCHIAIEGLIITGGVAFSGLHGLSLRLRHTSIRGTLCLVHLKVYEIDVRELTVKGTIEMAHLTVDYIRCNPQEAQAMHYAAPTTPLVIEGLLKE